MRRRRRHYGPIMSRRRPGGSAGRAVAPLAWCAIGIIAAVLMIGSLDAQLRPIVSELATAEVHNVFTSVMNDVVAETLEEGGWEYGDMVTVERDQNGQITSLRSNVVESNRLRTRVVEAVLAELEQLDIQSFDIALGSLFDFDIFSGRGPALRVRTMTVGSVSAQLDHIFVSAGINQTRHQITLKISVPVTILIASNAVKTEVTTSICIAETVIVGTVPDTYLQIPSAN